MGIRDAGLYVWQTLAVIQWSALLLDSYRHWSGDELVTRRDPEHDAEALFNLTLEVVSHGVEDDPIFNYANRSALRLWETDWDRFTSMPSRLSAKSDAQVQAERARALNRAKGLGYVQHYAGVRVTTKGRPFEIENASIWTIVDASGKQLGQAAMLLNYKFF